MRPLLWLLFGVWSFAHAATVSVEAEGVGPEEEVRQELYRLAVAQLVRDELGNLQLDVDRYQRRLEERFTAWFAQAEERLLAGKQGDATLATSIDAERRKARWVFLGYERFLKRYSVTKFGAHAERLQHWHLTLEAELDQEMLLAHAQRVLEESRHFRKLLLLPEVTLENFTWPDLKLENESAFLTPVASEWLRWFTEHVPADVEEVSLCVGPCAEAVLRWRSRDPKELANFVDPELLGSLLLSSKLSLSREQLSAQEVRCSFTGGVLLYDLNTKQVLHWADLPRESQTLRLGDQKKFNSQLASTLYRYPLGKFLEAKNQIANSVATTSAVVVRLVNPRNLGEALRFIEWLRLRGASLQTQAKLDSFNSTSARLLVHFRGEGNKFKALVSAASELESEWGRSVQIEDQGSELVVTLAKKP